MSHINVQFVLIPLAGMIHRTYFYCTHLFPQKANRHTHSHTPQISPAGAEVLHERASLLNWLLGYASMMLQPADSLLNDVLYFL